MEGGDRMAKYYYTLEFNDSMEAEDIESGKFEWKHGNGYIEASCFEEFVQLFEKKFSKDINEVNDWETDYEDSEDGTLWISNSVDGLGLRFRVECK
jgi:hypothetical protein